MVKRPFLRWLTDVPRPYTSILFRALATSGQVNLEVYYGRSSMGSHPWSEPIESGFVSRLYRTRLGVDWDLVRRAVSERSSIFVIAGWNDPTMWLCVLARRLFGLPYWIYTDTPDSGWVSRGRLKTFLRAGWVRFTLAGADRVWGTGRPAQERLVALGAAPDRVANLPYFIDLDRYDRPRQPPAATIVLGSAGQLVARKDLTTTLKALARLDSRGISSWTYRVVGTGPEEQALRDEARALGIGEKVEFLGWLEGDSLVQFFAGCDVFVHPCEFEPWGVVVMEAMASGAAVVCSDQTFVALDWVVPEESGLIHRTWNDEDLAEKLEWVMRDPARIGRMGEEGRSVVRKWPVSRGVDRVVECAEELSG